MEVREPGAKYLLSRELQLTELGPLPADWGVSTVGDEFHVQLGKMLDTEKNVGTPKPFVGNRAVQWGRIDVSDIGEIRLSPTDLQRYRLEEGDLLVCEGGEVGRSAIWRGQLDECYYQKALHRLRAKRGYSHEFMAALMEQFARSGKLQDYVTQTSIAHLPKEKFVALLIPRPATEDEQCRISQAIGDADALIDSLEQLLTKKRQIKQGAMQELLTGQRRLPGFSDMWVPRSMADLFDFSGGLSASREQLGDSGSCYLHYGDIHLCHKTYIDLDAEHHQMPRLDVDLRKVSASALLRNGDVVFVDASEDDQGVSKHVVIHSREVHRLISGLHTIVAKPKACELIDLYKRYCFQASPVHAQFRFYSVGTKVSGVSKGNIGKIMLNVPSHAEQAEIAACLAEMDTELTALEARLTKARALKQAMAQALLTGRIRLVEPTA